MLFSCEITFQVVVNEWRGEHTKNSIADLRKPKRKINPLKWKWMILLLLLLFRNEISQFIELLLCESDKKWEFLYGWMAIGIWWYDGEDVEWRRLIVLTCWNVIHGKWPRTRIIKAHLICVCISANYNLLLASVPS